MKYHFHHTVVIDEKTYPQGVREVADQLVDHPHFLHFVKAGYIGEADQDAPRLRSAKERSEALIKTINERLAAKGKPDPSAEEAKGKPDGDDEMDDSPKPKGKKK